MKTINTIAIILCAVNIALGMARNDMSRVIGFVVLLAGNLAVRGWCK